jgi:hypothetical protein
MRNTSFSRVPVGLILLGGSPLSAATFMVTTTADSGPGSLRDAITLANATPGPDLIHFSIPGAGVQTIVPLSPLPPLTDPSGVWIDGFTQPGAGPGGAPPATATLLIELQGILAGACDGITIQSDNNQVQGLVINQFAWDGIHIEGGVANPSADFNLVQANFVGTDPSGTVDLGNGTNTAALRSGIHVGNTAFGSAMNNTIDANLVSGNWAEGIRIAGPIQPGAVGTNFVTSNFVGTDRSGALDLGNDHQGVALTEGTTANQILFNVVSGNDYDGIGLQGLNNVPFPQPPIQTSNNLIAQNIVGLDASATSPLPNAMHGITLGTYGPSVWGCADANTIDENVIAYNGGDGIAVVEDFVDTVNADGNRITRNAVWSNMGLGIDLGDDGVTPDDPGDLDTGANQELNYPVLTSALYTPAKTLIRGTLQIDVSPSLALVEIFKARVDPTGHGEGEVYLGSSVPAPDGSWSFTTTQLLPGDRVTTTATDSSGNTSEFSQVRKVIWGKVLQESCAGCPTVSGSVP